MLKDLFFPKKPKSVCVSIKFPKNCIRNNLSKVIILLNKYNGNLTNLILLNKHKKTDGSKHFIGIKLISYYKILIVQAQNWL